MTIRPTNPIAYWIGMRVQFILFIIIPLTAVYNLFRYELPSIVFWVLMAIVAYGSIKFAYLASDLRPLHWEDPE